MTINRFILFSVFLAATRNKNFECNHLNSTSYSAGTEIELWCWLSQKYSSAYTPRWTTYWNRNTTQPSPLIVTEPVYKFLDEQINGGVKYKVLFTPNDNYQGVIGLIFKPININKTVLYKEIAWYTTTDSNKRIYVFQAEVKSKGRKIEFICANDNQLDKSAVKLSFNGSIIDQAYNSVEFIKNFSDGNHKIRINNLDGKYQGIYSCEYKSNNRSDIFNLFFYVNEVNDPTIGQENSTSFDVINLKKEDISLIDEDKEEVSKPSTTKSPEDNAGTDDKNKVKDNNLTGKIVGGVIGAIIVLILIVGLAYYFLNKK